MKVLYAGGKAIMAHRFSISPFYWEDKVLEFRNLAIPFIEGLKKNPDIDVTQLAGWDVHREFPGELEKLQEYDVLVLQDVSTELFYFYPVFFTEEGWQAKEEVVRPNRLETIRKFVEKGGGLLMSGGWDTFQGRFAHAQWHDTPVEKVLPVELSDKDDRVETPEGSYPSIVDSYHPVVKDIPWDKCPAFLGYNKATLKDDAKLLANVKVPKRDKNKTDPLIAVLEYGKGRSMVFTSDILPHWGLNFVKWEHYKQFVLQAIKWLAKKC